MHLKVSNFILYTPSLNGKKKKNVSMSKTIHAER